MAVVALLSGGPAGAAEKEYAVSGMGLSVDPAAKSFTVSHERIGDVVGRHVQNEWGCRSRPACYASSPTIAVSGLRLDGWGLGRSGLVLAVCRRRRRTDDSTDRGQRRAGRIQDRGSG